MYLLCYALKCYFMNSYVWQNKQEIKSDFLFEENIQTVFALIIKYLERRVLFIKTKFNVRNQA